MWYADTKEFGQRYTYTAESKEAEITKAKARTQSNNWGTINVYFYEEKGKSNV